VKSKKTGILILATDEHGGTRINRARQTAAKKFLATKLHEGTRRQKTDNGWNNL